jgi:hypothetical protein
MAIVGIVEDNKKIRDLIVIATTSSDSQGLKIRICCRVSGTQMLILFHDGF